MSGRYRELRACERVSVDPVAFACLPPQQQAELIAYAEIRDKEEARMRSEELAVLAAR